jgi:dihydrofolate reductase
MEAIIVAAMSINRVIGKDNKIPWHLPKDIEHFLTTTQGQVVVMGNKTFDSLKRKPFKRRTNVVITSDVEYAPEEDVYKFRSFDEVKLTFAYRYFVYVIGGESIYKLAFQELKVRKIYLTIIHQFFDGDTFFPEFDLSKYRCVKAETHKENGLEFTFVELDLVE